MDIIIRRWNNEENKLCAENLPIEERIKFIKNISEIFSENDALVDSFLNLLELEIKRAKDFEYFIRITTGRVFEIWAKKQKMAELILRFLLSELSPGKIVGIVAYTITIHQDEIKK